MRELKNFINGEYVASKSGETSQVINPANGEAYATAPVSSAADVDAAYQAAQKGFEEWSNFTPGERQLALFRIADALEARAEEAADVESENTGKPRSTLVEYEMAPSVDQIRFFAGAARLLNGTASGEYLEGLTSSIRREPVGVVGQVTPWNYPLMMAVWKIAPALAAGNTVVLKPSDTTPESTLLLAEIAAPFFPKGAFNVVLGQAQVGSKVVSHKTPALVSITGSVRAGLQVAASAAANLAKAHLELGGKAPVVVFEDADLDKAVEMIALTGYFNAGQDCTAATRVIVAESVHDEFLSKLVEAAKNTRFGEPDDQDALYGPLNNANQLKNVKAFIDNLPAHAKVETGGKQADRPGFYFEPTVISGLKQHDEAIQNEILSNSFLISET